MLNCIFNYINSLRVMLKDKFEYQLYIGNCMYRETIFFHVILGKSLFLTQQNFLHNKYSSTSWRLLYLVYLLFIVILKFSFLN